MITDLYADVARALSLPAMAQSIADGKADVLLPGTVAPAELYGFPPALIPLWSEGSGPNYVGYWAHWFAPRRPTFVVVHVEGGYRPIEVARTFRQLALRLLLGHICLADGVTARVRQVAERLGVSEDVEVIDQISQSTGDDPSGLLAHPAFRVDPPLQSVPKVDLYQGDFPSSTKTLRQAAGLELSADLEKAAQASNDSPPWLKERNRSHLFESLLDAGRLGDAWLCLNSPGWRFADVKRALSAMARQAASQEFGLLASAWSALPQERYGGY
jgi:hypothetical protein